MRTKTKTAITALTALTASLSASSAMAALPPAGIHSVHPVDGGVYQVARIAPYTKGGPERWRVRAHVVVQNTGGTAITLASTNLSYPKSPVPPLDVVATDTNDDPNVDSRVVAPGKTAQFVLEDGMARPGGAGGDRSLFFPVAEQIRFSLRFAGYSDPLVHTSRMRAYVNKTPQGSYLFPAKHADLASGEHWSVRIHKFSRTQKFAYDFGVSRWDPAKKTWSGLKPGTNGAKNTDYLVYGKPVYAMASGTIVKCTWSQKDQTPGVDDGTANHFWIDHGNGEFALYAHLQEGSVNPQLCPKNGPENTYGLKIPVAAGQLLGRAGKTGTTGPHLHVHISQGANGKPFGGNSQSGLPLLFRAAKNVSTIDKAMLGPGPFDYNTMNGQAPAAPFNLINLSPLPFGTP